MKSESANIFRSEPDPISVTFLVFDGASIMCVASAIDPLRAANRILGRRHFDWRVVSRDGRAPVTTSGLPIQVAGAFEKEAVTDVLVMIGGFGARDMATPAVLAAIRRMAPRLRAIGGIEAGTWLLGHAGILNGRAATTHWEDLEDFAVAFPEAEVRPDRYVIDGPVFTAGGASPCFDLMLHLVRSRLGMVVALDVASVFIYDQARAASDAQPLVSLGRLDGYDERLARAIRLMESRVDRPLTVAAIAARVGTTRRTLEVIFARSIGESPGAYYLRLRLNVARRLVLDTREPMADIAVRTGFSGGAAFSRAFSRAFATSPARMRKAQGG